MSGRTLGAGAVALSNGPPVVVTVPALLGPGVRPPHVGTPRAPWPQNQPQQPQTRGVEDKKLVQIPAPTERVIAPEAVPASTGHRVPPSTARTATAA